jgi:hypothetical protein
VLFEVFEKLTSVCLSKCHEKPSLFKDYSTLGVHYRDLQARAHEQETRNLTLHEAQPPSAVLNFEFLVRERVLVNPDNARTKSALNVLIFSLSKP